MALNRIKIFSAESSRNMYQMPAGPCLWVKMCTVRHPCLGGKGDNGIGLELLRKDRGQEAMSRLG